MSSCGFRTPTLRMCFSALRWHRRYGLLSVLVMAALAVALFWLQSTSLLAPCAIEAGGIAGEHKFRALEVVVQPWQGRHQVYGVFKVPERYKNHRLYYVTLAIEGFKEKYAAGSPDIEERDNIVPEPGYYFRKAYIPTRDALRFLLTGRFGDLQTPCHWWLIYTHRQS